MFKLFLLSLFVLAPLGAEASKAKILSLQGARFLRDNQTIFINPAHVNSLKSNINAEFGDTSNSGDPKAEGGILADKFGGKAGLYLGHLDVIQKRLRDPESYYIEQNPIELTFGNGTWGTSFFYSRSSDDTTTKGQKTLGMRLGHADENFEVYTTVNIIGENRPDAAKKYKLTGPAVNLGAEYSLGKYYIFGEATYANSQQDITIPVTQNRATVTLRTYEAGVQDLSFSNATRTVYYGVSLKYDEFNKHVTSIYNLTLPFVIGLETPVADWATIRTSLTQNFLVGYTRNQTLTSPGDRKDSVANNTSASAGVSLKFKDFEMDGVAQGSTTGEINGNSILAKVSLTYAL